MPNREEDERATPEEMAEWFLSIYEDPCHHVPYESKEGGYQYVFGGPYDAEEALGDEFPGASDADIKAALKIIEEEGGPEWVRKADYR